MAAEPEINRLAREYREREGVAPTGGGIFDGLDWEDLMAADFGQDPSLIERRIRLFRCQLAAWLAPKLNTEGMLRESQDYHGTRAKELAAMVDDKSYEPATVLSGAQIWIATALQVRHLEKAHQATEALEQFTRAD